MKSNPNPNPKKEVMHKDPFQNEVIITPYDPDDDAEEMIRDRWS
jgi:hypothetical protein